LTKQRFSAFGEKPWGEDEIYLHLHAPQTGARRNVVEGSLNQPRASSTAETWIEAVEGSADREFGEKIGLRLLEFQPNRFGL
jgi:hypothetical protein